MSVCPLVPARAPLADYTKFDIDFYEKLSRNSEHFSIRHDINYFLEAQSVYHNDCSAYVA
jgi:hypothetical protein